MKKSFKQFASVFIIVFMLIGILPATALAAGNYDVSTADELKAAITEINALGTGNYTITLTDDLADVSDMGIINNATITFIGNGHSISMKTRSMFHLRTGATVNLGDGSSALTFIGSTYNDDPGLFVVPQGCTLNMYNGVTIKDNSTTNHFGGGVSVNGGIFNMNGGTIDNCGIRSGSVCFGGGVAVTQGGTFNMSGGTIKNCYAATSLPSRNKGLIPWGAGGGVFLCGGATFNMSGGTIDGCRTSESGGGVFMVASIDSYFDHSSFGFVDSCLNLTGGTIKNCTAGYYGGGIMVDGYYVNASAIGTATPTAGTAYVNGFNLSGSTITDNTADLGGGFFAICLDDSLVRTISGANLCNNKAVSEGADFYLSDGSVSLFDASKMTQTYKGLPSDLKGKAIGAWFEDYADLRFEENAEDCIKITSQTITADDSGDIALIAAPDPKIKTVTFDQNYDGKPDNTNKTITKGSKADKPSDPTRENYTFLGWYTDEDGTSEFNFDTPVNEDITLYAKWEVKKISIKVTKSWDDENDSDGIRPDEISVNLLANGEIYDGGEIGSREGWVTYFNELPIIDAAGNKIIYTVKEDPVDGYTSNVSGDMTSGFVIVNVHTPEKPSPTPDPSPKPTDPTPTSPDPSTSPVPSGNPGPDGPKTGDDYSIFLWLALIAISGGAAAMIIIYLKKKHTEK